MCVNKRHEATIKPGYRHLLALLLFLFASALAAQAQTPASDFTYTVSNGQVDITGYFGVAITVVVPSRLAGLPVTSVDVNAFGNTSVASVTISQGVTTIGDDCFYGCTNLRTVVLPASLRSIGDDAFDGCPLLSSFTVNAANPNFSTPAGVLMNKAATSLIRFPSTMGGAYTIPSTVTTVANFAFANNTVLTSVTIPKSVTTWGASVFQGCTQLATVTFAAGSTSMGVDMFDTCAALRSIALPDRLTTLPDQAFIDCTNLTSVVFPKTLTSIGANAFAWCSKLASPVIPAGVTTIGDSAFSECWAIKTVTIPAGVTQLSDDVFVDCMALTTISIPANITSVGISSFAHCSALTAITLPDGVTSIGETAFFECSSLTTFHMPSSLTSLGDDAFDSCSKLTAIAIPNGVTTIGAGEFGGCSALASVTLPANLTSIGAQAFGSCTVLPSITIPATVTSIGYDAFASCSGLSYILFEGNAPTLGSSALGYGDPTTVFYQHGATGFTSPTWTYDSAYDSIPAVDISTLSQPVITSAATAPDATYGTAYGQSYVYGSSYTVTASGFPTSFFATGLPPGLTIDPVRGGILGTPTQPGTYVVQVSATNPFTGTGTGSFSLTVKQAGVFFYTDPVTVTYNGKPQPLPVYSNPQVTYTETYNGSTTPPTDTGTYTIVVTSTSPDYTGTGTLTYIIQPISPVAKVTSVTALTATSVVLKGTVNPMGTDTHATFNTGAALNNYSSASFDVGSGSSPVAVTATITFPSTASPTQFVAYLYADNGTTYAFSNYETFAPPTARGFGTYNGASPPVSATGIRITMPFNPGGMASSAYFIYGTDPNNLNLQSPAQNIGNGKTLLNVTADLSGLQPHTTYYFELVVVGPSGTMTSTEESFGTLRFDTTVVAATWLTTPGSGNTGAGVNWSSLGSGALNAHDAVAFKGTLNELLPGITVTPPVTVIWANLGNSGTFSPVANTIDHAPDAGGNSLGAYFATLTDPILNDNGDVAFGGTLKITPGIVTAANQNGIWATSSGALGLLARQGSPAPGVGGATFAKFTSLAISDTGAIVASTITGGSPAASAANNSCVWEGLTSNDLTLWLRNGETTDAGKTIASFQFLPSDAYLTGQTRGFAPATGHLAATAVYTDKTSGIITVKSPGSPTAVATVGDIAAGTNGAVFSSFGSPAINATDDVAFQATLKPGVGGIEKVDAGGIWAVNSIGTLWLVAQLGQPAPYVDSYAPFTSFSDPAYNDLHSVVFRATLSTTGPSRVTTAKSVGLWSNNAGGLSLIAETGYGVPGCPDGVVLSAINQFAIDNTSAPFYHAGGVIFLTTLSGTGVTAANNTAIFAQGSGGDLELIARTGDQLNGKTITALSFLPAEPTGNGSVASQTRSFAPSTGDLLYTATFSDKSQAIFNVVYP